MGQALKKAPYITAIQETEPTFTKMAKTTGLDFAKESLLAMEAIKGNDFLAKAANDDVNSLQMAVVNVATVGLSLLPATGYAYLVPRSHKKGERPKICLDISYRGLIKIATDAGSILWAKADVVHANDGFIWKGVHEVPEHTVGNGNAFTEDRGDMVGVYCIAKTADGDFISEMMDSNQVNTIRESSPSKDSDYGPWKKYVGEMWKKVCIKRASKTWPRTDRSERLQEAIEIINDHEGIEFEWEHTPEQWDYYQWAINKSDPKPAEYFLFYCSLEVEEKASLARRHKRPIDRGEKGNESDRINALRNQGEEMVADLVGQINLSEDLSEIQEIYEEQGEEVRAHLLLNMDAERANAITELNQEFT